MLKQEFDEDGNLLKVKAYGGGYGHGVGMSQYGAGYMATQLKMPYDKILKHYYTGISLTTVPFILSSANNQKEKIQTFYSKNGRANLVVDNKYKTDYIDAVINGVDEKIELDTAERLNVIDLSPYLQKGLNTVKFTYPEINGNKGLRIYIELVGKNE